MNESKLLHHIYDRSADLPSKYMHVAVGPGDDCAAVRGSSGDLLLITVDQLIEGVHFLPGAAVDRIARKLIARSVSDIAAMGGSPSWALATGALPPDYPRADQLFDAMARWARHFGCPLVGGDIAMLSPASGRTTRLVVEGNAADAGAGLVLTCTVAGSPHPRRGPVLRSGARAGDEVWVTGRLGGSYESGRHFAFEPRIREGLWLCEHLGDRLHAMIDLSDGLGRDAGRIALASGVRLELHAVGLPVHENVFSWEDAVGGGEDYELCFTVAPGAALPAECPHTGAALTCIGRVLPGAGCCIIDPQDRQVDASEMGWDHGGTADR